jgi:hypothetical protein
LLIDCPLLAETVKELDSSDICDIYTGDKNPIVFQHCGFRVEHGSVTEYGASILVYNKVRALLLPSSLGTKATDDQSLVLRLYAVSISL